MARSEKVSYWRGKHATIPTNRISGRILVEEDTGDLFLEYNDFNKTTGIWEVVRKQLTDSRKFNTSGGVYQGPVVLYMHPDEVKQYIEENGLDWSIDHIAATKHYVDNVKSDLNSHVEDSSMHIGTHDGIVSEREYWNSKVDSRQGYGLSENNFSRSDKQKLDKIPQDASVVKYTQELTDGQRIGTIQIDGQLIEIYAPKSGDFTGNAISATKLETPRLIDGIKFDGSKNIIHYGKCISEASSEIKIVSIEGFDLAVGAKITVQFLNDNTADDVKLQISDSESYPIYYKNSPIDKTKLVSGLYEFVYTGQSYELVKSICDISEISVATENTNGLMSSDDKKTLKSMSDKLSTIDPNANNYTLPIATNEGLGGVKLNPDTVSIDSVGHIYLTKANITNALGYIPLEGGGSIEQQTFKGAQKPSGAYPQGLDGTVGFVPAPEAISKDYDKFLKGDGSWATPSEPPFKGATQTEAGAQGSVPAPTVEYQKDGEGNIVLDENLNPTVISSDYNKFLCGDGTWKSVDASSISVSTITIAEIDEIINNSN